MGQEETIRALADRAEITDLIYRYCRAVDRIDVPLGQSVFHEDATADYPGHFQGGGRAVIEHICASHSLLLHHAHQMGNILIELDGDTAGSESYVTATLRMRREGKLLQMTVWSRYVDIWARKAGRWGIQHRMAIRDFDEIREVTAMQEHDVGKRDQNDPSYRVLKGITA